MALRCSNLPTAARAYRTGPAPRARRTRARRGVMCVVAMLFLILFAVLAIGFYAGTAMSAQMSANERVVHTSQLAAESGMGFIRYQLASLDIPSNVPPSKVFEEVYLELACMLEGSRNMGGSSVGYDGRTITIPEGDNVYVRLEKDGPGFRVTMTDVDGERIRVKVTGWAGNTRARGRGIEYVYELANRKSTVFDYGVASRGAVQFKSTANTKALGTPDNAANILSTAGSSPSITTGKGTIDGDLAVAASTGQVTLGGGTVGGSSSDADILASHVHVVAPPEFPFVHTVVFKPFATNLYKPGVPFQKNVRVPPNTNPTFSGGDVIEGILYIESPNAVTFAGHATVNGLIVFENAGTPAQNSLDFKGNVSPATIPNTPEYAALRERAQGLAIAAPTATVRLTGSVDGNISGSVIGASLALAGSADLTIHNGSMINLGATPTLVEGKTVHFVGLASANPPYAGVRFRSYFRLDPSSYREVAP